nr:MAG TPA: protein of unknown function (DUF4428) [Caudoviricetes sp.]
MGLFGAKKMCCVCGGKLPFLATSIMDGEICRNCREKCTQRLDVPSSRSTDDIIRCMADAENNKRLYQIFQAKDYGCGLRVDFANKLWCVCTPAEYKSQSAYIFQFSDFVDYDYMEDGKTIQKSGAGAAVAGGLLFGGIGMVAGALAGRKNKEVIKKLSIILHVKNEWCHTIELPIITNETKKGSFTYNLSKTVFENLSKVLDEMQIRVQ